MPALSNPKHERFAQELAKGKSASEAYVAAGYKHNTGNAATLKAQESVLKRFDEILKAHEARDAKAMEIAADHLALSRADILGMLIKDRELAHKMGQAAPAIKAAELLGKELHKMFVDRKEIGAPGEFDNADAAELRRAIAAEAEALGIHGQAIEAFGGARSPGTKLN